MATLDKPTIGLSAPKPIAVYELIAPKPIPVFESLVWLSSVTNQR